MRKISVTVPFYNVAHCLDQCMRYLFRQTIGIENMEIILVDDAPTDDGATGEKILEYERLVPERILAIFLKQDLRQGSKDCRIWRLF